METKSDLFSFNPSSLTQPIRTNEKFFNKQKKENIKKECICYEYEEYNFRSNIKINEVYKSNDRLLKNYKQKYEFEEDHRKDEKKTRNLLPRIFYRIYAKKE